MAFVKRARLPQAEDSAPMRVSRIGTASQRSPRLSPVPILHAVEQFFKRRCVQNPKPAFADFQITPALQRRKFAIQRRTADR